MTAVGDDAAWRSPDEIENDIDATRARLGATLEALERKLAPERLLEEGMDMARDTMNDNLGRLGETLRENPIPLALVGLGVGWLLLSGSGKAGNGAAMPSVRRVGEKVAGAFDRVTEAASEARDYAHARLKSGADAALNETLDQGRQAWTSAADYAGDHARQARSEAARLIDEHPLAIGALGFLAGIVAGAAFPAAARLGAKAAGASSHAADQAARDEAIVEKAAGT
jgi:hypothetical protein